MPDWDWGKYAPAIERQTLAFDTPPPEPTVPGVRSGKPTLAAPLPEWMMNFPPGWITGTPGVTRREAFELAGNGVVRAQAVEAYRSLLARVANLDDHMALA